MALHGLDESDLWYKKPPYIWIRNPMNNTKYLLVSWRMSGSEFCKQMIRENFPECIDIMKWGKTHIILTPELLNELKNVKVFFILADPREATTNIAFMNNGLHLHLDDYSEHVRKNKYSLEFLNANLDIINNLLIYYTKTFKNNCIVLKYEDALYNRDSFLFQVSKFLNLPPLNIDDVDKYKNCIHKNVGLFYRYYDENILNNHYNRYIWFYEKWGYPKEGYRMKENKISNSRDYYKFLERNGVFSIKMAVNNRNGAFPFDHKLDQRIKNIKRI